MSASIDEEVRATAETDREELCVMFRRATSEGWRTLATSGLGQVAQVWTLPRPTSPREDDLGLVENRALKSLVAAAHTDRSKVGLGP